ncbi:DgyrCDS14973 [Dimorphilus gyrociliatus]|uniref:DgyrCDS14973 n=1 Tax=Dimorphilus gyrociliatus TaxID=2664684 RepID=A0A7I8WFK0_9ANNE|nr:DgyrCDS14973 [Dimorphilus gyrociliatus]
MQRIEMIKIIIFAILTQNSLCLFDNICNITRNDRVQVGDASEDLSSCTAGNLCYEPGYGCFLSRLEKPGYRFQMNKNCYSNDINVYSDKQPTDCTQLCSSRNSCVAVALDATNRCYLKSKCEPISSETNVYLYIRLVDNRLTCFLGGIANTQSVSRGIEEKETANRESGTFQVNITGENLLCRNENEGIGNKGIFVYMPLENQVNGDFNGNFQSCRLINQNSTVCHYNCNCQLNTCQAVYVNLYDELEVLKVCEISYL